MKQLSLIIIALFTLGAAQAQALYPVPLTDKVENASLILEGRVRKGQPFWNPAHTMIFTAWSLDIYKIFKGDLPAGPVQVLTQGGFIGDEGIAVSELLQLEEGVTGIFFLFPNGANLKAPGSGAALYDVYSSAQGVLKYAVRGSGAYAPFARYETVAPDLYDSLASMLNGGYREIEPRPAQLPPSAGKTTATITGLTPLRVHAGAHDDPANNTLTIRGSGFGPASGAAAVAFDDPDDGANGNFTTLAYNNPLVTSWTDTQIVVKVPAGAGTGVVNIYDNLGTLAASPNLGVDYAVMAVNFGSGPQEVNMMNANGLGGYSISYSTSTSGSGINMITSTALGTFQRALATHRETGGVNFSDSTGGVINTTTSQTISAGAQPNLVAYDNANTGLGAPLPAGTLAVCYSGFGRCSGTNIGVRRTGFDILLRNPGYSTGTTTFTSGPCPPAETSVNELDLETVILHELGHAVNQAHVIDDYQYVGGGYPGVNPASVMNYALLNGVKRSSYDNSLLSGVTYTVTPGGQLYGACSGAPFTEMIPLSAVVSARDECSGLFPAAVPGNGATIAFDLAHATSNKNTDPQYTALRTNGAGTAVTNTQYFAFSTTAVGGTVNVGISNYTTAPATQAGCINGGVEFSLYTLSSCPAGQAYPLPVAQRSFAGNGALSPFTGLTGNTSYLLVADGIENTKAQFNAVFTSATALPVRLRAFNGRSQTGHNLLSWSFDPGNLPQSVTLERSLDGREFLPLYAEPVVFHSEGSYTDAQPQGTNYYRLRMAEKGGHEEFSAIVLLTAPGSSRLALAPVPVRNSTTLYYDAPRAGRIDAALFHSTGQLAARWTFNTTPGENAFQLDLEAYAAGSYTLRINSGGHAPAQYLRLVKQ